MQSCDGRVSAPYSLNRCLVVTLHSSPLRLPLLKKLISPPIFVMNSCGYDYLMLVQNCGYIKALWFYEGDTKPDIHCWSFRWIFFAINVLITLWENNVTSSIFGYLSVRIKKCCVSPKNGPRNSRYTTGSCIKHFNPPFNPPLNTLPVKDGFFLSKTLLLQSVKTVGVAAF